MVRTLRNYNHETPARANGRTYTLVTAVRELRVSGDEIRGELEYDVLVPLNFRGQVQQYPTTINKRFFFDLGRFRRTLVILETGQDMVAEKLSRIIFGNSTDIAEGKITAEDISDFIDRFSEVELAISWKDVRIRGLNKVTLRGPEVTRARLDYNRYNRSGKKYYVMIRLRREHWVISISDDGTVVLYSTGATDTEDFLNFLKRNIIPLIR